MINDAELEFFEFIFDRQEIWLRRNILKYPAPWTNDEILRDYKFCNVYRELDGGTIALTKYLQQADYSQESKLFTLTAYRFFNRRDTIENLFGGMLNPETFDFKALEKRFDDKKLENNIFSNAYLISSHPYRTDYRPKDKHVQILLMLDDLKSKIKDFAKDLQNSKADEGLPIVRRYVPLSGPFLSGQILLDATYCKGLVSYTSNDFLIVGPGAHWGLEIICGRKLSKREADAKCRCLWQIQAEGFAKLKQKSGKDWFRVRWEKPDYPNAPYLSLHDIQNSLCEFRKYKRLKDGEKAKKRYFKI